MQVSYNVEFETEKAYAIDVASSWDRRTKYVYVPKSISQTETFVATVDPFNNPKTYGLRIVEIADWFARKNNL